MIHPLILLASLWAPFCFIAILASAAAGDASATVAGIVMEAITVAYLYRAHRRERQGWSSPRMRSHGVDSSYHGDISERSEVNRLLRRVSELEIARQREAEARTEALVLADSYRRVLTAAEKAGLLRHEEFRGTLRPLADHEKTRRG